MHRLLSIHDLGFGSPEYLPVLAVVPLLALFAWFLRRRRARYSVSFTNVDLVVRVLRSRGRRRSRNVLGLAVLALGLAVLALALARPHVQMTTANRTGTIVLLVDVSDSMRALDIRPSRLTAVVTALHDFLAEVPPGDKVGLVTFSDKVEVLARPTTDRASVRARVDTLTPQGGTSLGDGVEGAVRLVVETLAADGIRHKPGTYLPGAIVVESDGAQNRGAASPDQAAQLAKATGVRIYGIALGKPHAFITQGSGYFALRIPVPPDPGSVGILVRESGGKAYAARNSKQLEGVYKGLGATIGERTGTTDITSWFEALGAALVAAATGIARVRGGLLP